LVRPGGAIFSLESDGLMKKSSTELDRLSAVRHNS